MTQAPARQRSGRPERGRRGFRGLWVAGIVLLALRASPSPGAGTTTRAAAPVRQALGAGEAVRPGAPEGAQPLANGSTAAAQILAPAPAPAGPYEDKPIRRGGREPANPPASTGPARAESDAATDPAGQGANGAAAGQNAMDLPKVALALAIVLVIVFLLQKVGRKIFPGAAAFGSNRAIRVLSRTTIAPRQQLLLIHVGRRLVLAANSGTQMNALCEITDPDEVAALVGQLPGEKDDPTGEGLPAAGAFQSAFGAAGRRYDAGAPAGGDAEDDEADETPATARRPAPRAASVALSDGHVARGEADGDPAATISATSEELGGLAEKVRRLSQQFHRP